MHKDIRTIYMAYFFMIFYDIVYTLHKLYSIIFRIMWAFTCVWIKYEKKTIGVSEWNKLNDDFFGNS